MRYNGVTDRALKGSFKNEETEMKEATFITILLILCAMFAFGNYASKQEACDHGDENACWYLEQQSNDHSNS